MIARGTVRRGRACLIALNILHSLCLGVILASWRAEGVRAVSGDLWVLVGLTGWLWMGWLCGGKAIKMALERNRSTDYAFMCFVLGPLPLVLLSRLPAKPYTAKWCAECLSAVPVVAPTCRHCGADVSAMALVRRKP
jgi:hypothetical protein